jgi:uncharacterized protein YndB with AHSA1/START domain
MQKEIRHTWQYSHTPQQIWDYLTKPELIEQWLMKTDFKPEVGAEFMFWTRPLPQFGFDGNIYCKVLEVTLFEKLSYTWKGGPGNGEFNLDSIVVWTLTKIGNGTELTLVHSGFKAQENYMMFTAMEAGWLKNIGKIEELLNEAK